MTKVLKKLEKKMKNISAEADVRQRRIVAEIEFAEGLTELKGRKGWSKLIIKAAELVEKANTPKKFEQAIDQAEKIISRNLYNG